MSQCVARDLHDSVEYVAYKQLFFHNLYLMLDNNDNDNDDNNSNNENDNNNNNDK